MALIAAARADTRANLVNGSFVSNHVARKACMKVLSARASRSWRSIFI